MENIAKNANMKDNGNSSFVSGGVNTIPKAGEHGITTPSPNKHRDESSPSTNLEEKHDETDLETSSYSRVTPAQRRSYRTRLEALVHWKLEKLDARDAERKTRLLVKKYGTCKSTSRIPSKEEAKKLEQYRRLQQRDEMLLSPSIKNTIPRISELKSEEPISKSSQRKQLTPRKRSFIPTSPQSIEEGKSKKRRELRFSQFFDLDSSPIGTSLVFREAMNSKQEPKHRNPVPSPLCGPSHVQRDGNKVPPHINRLARHHVENEIIPSAISLVASSRLIPSQQHRKTTNTRCIFDGESTLALCLIALVAVLSSFLVKVFVGPVEFPIHPHNFTRGIRLGSGEPLESIGRTQFPVHQDLHGKPCVVVPVHHIPIEPCVITYVRNDEKPCELPETRDAIPCVLHSVPSHAKPCTVPRTPGDVLPCIPRNKQVDSRDDLVLDAKRGMRTSEMEPHAKEAFVESPAVMQTEDVANDPPHPRIESVVESEPALGLESFFGMLPLPALALAFLFYHFIAREKCSDEEHDLAVDEAIADAMTFDDEQVHDDASMDEDRRSMSPTPYEHDDYYNEDDDEDYCCNDQEEEEDDVIEANNEGRYTALEIAQVPGTPHIKIRPVRRSRRHSKPPPVVPTSIPINLVLDQHRVLTPKPSRGLRRSSRLLNRKQGIQ